MRRGDPDHRGLAHDPATGRWTLTVWSPGTSEAWLVVGGPGAGESRLPMRREGECWVADLGVVDHRLDDDAHAGGDPSTGDALDGLQYHLEVDGVGPLLDPYAWAVTATSIGFRSVLRTRPWPTQPPLDASAVLGPDVRPVVYELHVRGFGRTFAGVAERLDHLVDLGVDVIELMPVHPFDTTTNYWGYMPLVWGAVHEGFAAPDADPADELAELIAAAHERHIAVWLDVVFNHTAEEDEEVGITTSWRGLAPTRAYRLHDGRFTNDSGCGNDVEPAEPEIQRLILAALDRFADLGVDGFRFDLATLLTRDHGRLARRIGDWALVRGVSLIAEPWDLGAYEVGPRFPDGRWSQWNDRFRDDIRGFLRAEPGLVGAVAQRIAGSPDLFPDEPWRSIDFVTAHDGLTLHDLTAVTSDHHRSWDCGPELRMQQLKNAFCYLLLSAGVPMFVMGDEFGRTQGGDPNPYRTDSPVTWVDWGRLDEWRELYEFVRALIGLRRRFPVVAPELHGVDGGELDTGFDVRALSWSTDELVVLANTSWEPAQFRVTRPGAWEVELATSSWTGIATADPRERVLRVGPRAVVVLTRDGAG